MTSTAIITGGSQGFGLAAVTALADDGWRVVTDARHAGELRAAVPAGVVAVPGDITDAAHRTDLLRQADAVDLLVLSAGTLGPSPLPRLRHLAPDELERVLAVNVVAQAALLREALPLLTPGAAVVGLSSDAAVVAYEGWGAYGASKAALDHLLAVLAQEEPQLSVWSLDPGDMRTAMHQAAFPGEDISDRPLPRADALRELLRTRPVSGRYRAADLVPVP
jgi:NAD(P)-dependent dehydrogenase (short-subunit alcohol dehydrogenase family)